MGSTWRSSLCQDSPSCRRTRPSHLCNFSHTAPRIPKPSHVRDTTPLTWLRALFAEACSSAASRAASLTHSITYRPHRTRQSVTLRHRSSGDSSKQRRLGLRARADRSRTLAATLHPKRWRHALRAQGWYQRHRQRAPPLSEVRSPATLHPPAHCPADARACALHRLRMHPVRMAHDGAGGVAR